MVNRNFERNRNYFEEIVNGTGSESRVIFKNQLRVGDTVKFFYGNYSYTGIVASTPRAVFGHYTARNTRNRLVTMFIFSSPTFSLPTGKVVEFVREVYDKTRLVRTQKTKYIPQKNIRSKFRWDRFWSSLKRLFKIDTDIPTLDSRNFRTFKLNNIGNCQRLQPRG